MEPNKDLVRRWADMFNAHDFTEADQIGASEYIEHAVAPFGTEEAGAVEGPAHLRSIADWLIGQFPDIRMTIEAIVAEGDLVAARVLSTGTNLGAIGKIPPTGRPFRAYQSHWFRVADGKLSEHWATRDDLVTMVQLGVISPPGPPRP